MACSVHWFRGKKGTFELEKVETKLFKRSTQKNFIYEKINLAGSFSLEWRPFHFQWLNKVKLSSFEMEWTWTQQEIMPCVEELSFSKASYTPRSVCRWRITAYYLGPPEKNPWPNSTFSWTNFLKCLSPVIRTSFPMSLLVSRLFTSVLVINALPK